MIDIEIVLVVGISFYFGGAISLFFSAPLDMSIGMKFFAALVWPGWVIALNIITPPKD